MDKRLREHMGGLIRRGRERLGFSQSHFGSLIGLQSHNSISTLERGSRLPPVATLARAADTVGVPLHKFFTLDDLVKAPANLREDERIVMDALATLSDEDARFVREMVDALLRARAEARKREPKQDG